MSNGRAWKREWCRVCWCLALGAGINFPLAWALSWRANSAHSGTQEIPVVEAPRVDRVARVFGPPVWAYRQQGSSLGITCIVIAHSKSTQEEITAARKAAPFDTGSGPVVGSATVWEIGLPWRSVRIVDLGFTGEKAVLRAIQWLSPTSLDKGWRTRHGFRSLIPGFALQPIPLGFALNTFTFACGFYGGRFMPGHARQWSRRRRGLCVGCGYEIKNLQRCPECGEAAAVPA